jgi:predicted lipoprotein with Yx(FWY)xxD motif
MRSTFQPLPVRLLAALGGLVLVVAACSSAGAAGSNQTTAAPGASAASGASGQAIVVTAGSGAAGAYLAGKDGLTLYTFTPDSKDTSTCTGACATNWPPFTVAAGDALNGGPGVAGTLSTFTRPDGTLQVAYDGLPLYYFAKDAKAGDTNGQGVGGKWFIASPQGAAASPAASPEGGKGTY